MLRASSVTVDPAYAPAKAMPSSVGKLGTIYMSVAGIIDVEAERKRLSGQLESLAKDLARVNGKLGNTDFLQKATPRPRSLYWHHEDAVCRRRSRGVLFPPLLRLLPHP